MNLIKRIRNLWRISKIDIQPLDNKPDIISKIFNKPKPEIIKRQDPIDTFLNEN